LLKDNIKIRLKVITMNKIEAEILVSLSNKLDSRLKALRNYLSNEDDEVMEKITEMQYINELILGMTK
jgi:hypothetical protein